MGKRLQVAPGCRVDKIFEMTNDIFSGEYKGHRISINRESDDDFYIWVQHIESGAYTYGGRWKHEGKDSIRDAVREALEGSVLLNR